MLNGKGFPLRGVKLCHESGGGVKMAEAESLTPTWTRNPIVRHTNAHNNISEQQRLLLEQLSTKDIIKVSEK